MLDEKKWAEIEPSIKALPNGEEFCKMARQISAIAEAMYLHTGFPNRVFFSLVRCNYFDVKWPLTFAAWYKLYSSSSVDQECADFFTNCNLWKHVQKILPTYYANNDLSGWAKQLSKYRKSFLELHPIKTNNLPSLAELKSKQKLVEAVDTKYQVFGSIGHKHACGQLSNSELDEIETLLGVHLPDEYRQFIQEIGYGAGPYYGVLDPREYAQELNSWRTKRQAGDIIPEPGLPFPLNKRHAKKCFKRMIYGKNGHFIAASPTNGCIPICHNGGDFFTYLVTAGDVVGNVWWSTKVLYVGDEIRPDYFIIAPQPPGILNLYCDNNPLWDPPISPLPSFLDWYNAWLDQCLSDFDELKQQEHK
jgi:hypothetical protein